MVGFNNVFLFGDGYEGGTGISVRQFAPAMSALADQDVGFFDERSAVNQFQNTCCPHTQKGTFWGFAPVSVNGKYQLIISATQQAIEARNSKRNYVVGVGIMVEPNNLETIKAAMDQAEAAVTKINALTPAAASQQLRIDAENIVKRIPVSNANPVSGGDLYNVKMIHNNKGYGDNKAAMLATIEDAYKLKKVVPPASVFAEAPVAPPVAAEPSVAQPECVATAAPMPRPRAEVRDAKRVQAREAIMNAGFAAISPKDRITQQRVEGESVSRGGRS